jgi:hypothetical protein
MLNLARLGFPSRRGANGAGAATESFLGVGGGGEGRVWPVRDAAGDRGAGWVAEVEASLHADIDTAAATSTAVDGRSLRITHPPYGGTSQAAFNISDQILCFSNQLDYGRVDR